VEKDRKVNVTFFQASKANAQTSFQSSTRNERLVVATCYWSCQEYKNKWMIEEG
jgi:hypothetical protein